MLPNKINLGPGIMNLSGCRLIPSPTDRPLWSLGADKLTDVSAGPIDYIDDNLELQTILAGSPLWVDGKLWQMGSWKEYCGYPTLPSSWVPSGAIKQPTGNYYGSFQEVNIIDSGGVWNRVIIYNSTVTGNPSVNKQFCSVLYKKGTSPGGRIICRDSTLSAESLLIYNGTTWSSTVQNAGNLSIYQDVEVFPGIRLLCFSITWVTASNSLSIGIGPNSTTGVNIVVYGASVNDIGFIWPLFNPNGGATILSRAGTSYCNMSLGVKNYKLLESLSGKVSGDNLVPNGDFSNGTSNWVLGTGWTVENGVLIGNGVGSTIIAANPNLVNIVAGAVYDVAFEIVENTLNGDGFGFSTSDSFHTATTYYNAVGKYTLRRSADATFANTLRIIIISSSTSGQIKIKNFSVKKVTEAAASKITFDWQPYYDSGDAAIAQTIFKTGSKTIAFDAMSGNITLNDGTNTTSVELTSWSAKDTIKFKMLCGDNHPDYLGVNKMQICASKDGGATWINSSVVDFDGSMINPGDTKFYHGGGTLPQAVSNVKACNIKSGDWPT